MQASSHWGHKHVNRIQDTWKCTVISPTTRVYITRIGYNAIDLQEKAVYITRVHVGYNAIEINQIKKFNISSIFWKQDHILLVHVFGIQIQNSKKMFVDVNKICNIYLYFIYFSLFLFKIVIKILIMQK
jgi:hypothetical protein